MKSVNVIICPIFYDTINEQITKIQILQLMNTIQTHISTNIKYILNKLSKVKNYLQENLYNNPIFVSFFIFKKYLLKPY